MQENNLYSIRNNSKKTYNKLEPKENKIKGVFNVNAPNKVWGSDTSYLKIKNKYYYICAILDLYSRKVLAYKISEKHSQNLISGTFKEAFYSRGCPKNLIHHSDRGAQYTATSFITLLKQLGVTVSYSEKGKPTDNAVIESFFSNLKQEEFYRRSYASLVDLKRKIGDYIHFKMLSVYKSLQTKCTC